jgi:ADP-ribose pyrophosphatase YjhB (NUDIX family)
MLMQRTIVICIYATDTFKEELIEMFSVGAFAIIQDEVQRVLLCHRTDMDFWNLPGGRAIRGELPTETVIRETREEVGLYVAVTKLIGVYGKRDRNGLAFVFECIPIGGKLGLSPEADALGWYTLADLPKNTLPRHVERISDALECNLSPIFRHHQAPPVRKVRVARRVKRDV